MYMCTCMRASAQVIDIHTYVLELNIVDCLIHLYRYVLIPLIHSPSPPSCW